MGAKEIIKAIPVVGPNLARAARTVKARRVFDNSGSYWESRYQTGGNSGAGSYNRLAEFKAQVLNDFVREHDVQSVLELGCGDGAQLALADYPKYIGSDVSTTVIQMCRTSFANDPAKEFFVSDELPPDRTADLTLSLDVIYHLVEDDVFDAYMRDLFARAGRFVGVYASNEDRRAPEPHVRHRRFTAWVEQHQPGWTLLSTVPNAYPFDPKDPEGTSFADFYFYEKRA